MERTEVGIAGLLIDDWLKGPGCLNNLRNLWMELKRQSETIPQVGDIDDLVKSLGSGLSWL